MLHPSSSALFGLLCTDLTARRGSGASHAEYGLDPPATEQRVSGALHSSDAALLIESSSRPNVALAGTLERDSTTDQTYC